MTRRPEMRQCVTNTIYVRKNGDLFREIVCMFNVKSEAGKTLMLQIQDEFDNDHDGYGLWERGRGRLARGKSCRHYQMPTGRWRGLSQATT